MVALQVRPPTRGALERERAHDAAPSPAAPSRRRSPRRAPPQKRWTDSRLVWNPSEWGNTRVVTFSSTEDGSDIWVPDLCVYETIDAQRIYDRVDYQASEPERASARRATRAHRALDLAISRARARVRARLSPRPAPLSCGALLLHLLLLLPRPMHARRSRTTAL